MKVTTTLIALLSSAFVAQSAPIEARDVYVPRILYPNAGTVWNVNKTYTVKWDASNPPDLISNRFSVRLNKEGRILPIILAQDFNPRGGQVKIKVPWVVPGNDYQITLFGDSGNQSPKFKIQ